MAWLASLVEYNLYPVISPLRNKFCKYSTVVQAYKDPWGLQCRASDCTLPCYGSVTSLLTDLPLCTPHHTLSVVKFMPEYTVYVDFILKSLDLILASLSCVFLVPGFFVIGNVKDGNHISFFYEPLTLWLIFVKLSWCMVTEPLRDWNSLVTCRQLQGVHLGTGGGLRDMNIPGGRPCIVTCSSECLLSWVWHLFFFLFLLSQNILFSGLGKLGEVHAAPLRTDLGSLPIIKSESDIF